MLRSGVLAISLTVLHLSMVPAGAAAVDLELRAVSPPVVAGDTVRVALIARSDDGTSQPFAGLDVLLAWDPAVLALVGTDEVGAFEWSLSYFPNDGSLDGLNADCSPTEFCESYSGLPFNDGLAAYQAVMLFADVVPVATSDGVVVTTFVFDVLEPAALTQVASQPEAGLFSFSRVVAFVEGGFVEVTGALRSSLLSVGGCGSHGDFDGDCVVTGSDYPSLATCLTGPASAPVDAACQAGDTDGDGAVDLRDVAVFQALFSGP